MSESGPVENFRVCVAHPGWGVYSETFIHAHVERLPCEVIELRGGLPPVCYDRKRLLSASFPAKAWRHLVIAAMRWPKDRFQVRAIARFLKQKNVDVVLAEYGETAIHLLDACAEAGVPLVACFHGYDAYGPSELRRYKESHRRLFREAAAVIAVSKDMRKQLADIGAPQEKIFYNPCAVDRSRFAGAHPETAPPVFLAVGRFVEKKAPHLTLLAFKKTLDVCPEAKLVMIGDGPLYGQCRYMSAAYGFAKAVDFRGACTHEEVVDAMRGARAFVQHSVRAQNGDVEGTPVAVLEAAASGLPIVATAHKGINDVVEPGETGYLVAEGDVDAMAERMILLARDPELAGRLGKNARERLPERYDMEKNMQALHDILRSAAKWVR